MKIKKILSAIISAAICCSFLPANISADEFDLPSSTDSYVSLMGETVNGNNSVISALPDGCQLEDIEIIPAQLNGVSMYSNGNSYVSTYANANFVMGLDLSAANPESVINGSPTNETILYWLWSNGEEQYTYDPAGNEIVQYYVFGLDDYMLGTLSIGDEVVGFATKFTEAGPQEFQYFAENSNGDICGTSYSITIEPADGSNRPVGNLQVSSGTYYTNTNIVFSWSNSYDADVSDYIVCARVRVYNENNVLLTEDSEYSLSMDNQNKRFTLNFANTGIHRVYISVSDNHNNWSSWVGGQINVQEKITYYFDDVSLTSEEVNNTNRTRFTWYDYLEAVDLQYQTDNAKWLYDYLKTNEVPEEVRRTTIINDRWTVSGYVRTPSGLPLSNVSIQIEIPINGGNFIATVTTDSSGYFSYTCSDLTQWFSARNVYFEPQVPINLEVYGGVAKWCRYGDSRTTSWYQPTTMRITCSAAGDETTIPVTALAGCSFARWLGYRWVDGIPGNPSSGWYDIS